MLRSAGATKNAKKWCVGILNGKEIAWKERERKKCSFSLPLKVIKHGWTIGKALPYFA
jgi:hypothetical protein